MLGNEEGVGACIPSGHVVLVQATCSSIFRLVFPLGQFPPKSEQVFLPPTLPSLPLPHLCVESLQGPEIPPDALFSRNRQHPVLSRDAGIQYCLLVTTLYPKLVSKYMAPLSLN